MEDGEDFAMRPQPPKLDSLPVPEEPSTEESYGREYYSANSSMRETAPARVQAVSKAGGGWLTLVLIGGAAACFYFRPDAVSSAIAAMERWILSLRGQVFEEGKGYGDIPVTERFETPK